jgi:hypothetical protein
MVHQLMLLQDIGIPENHPWARNKPDSELADELIEQRLKAVRHMRVPQEEVFGHFSQTGLNAEGLSKAFLHEKRSLPVDQLNLNRSRWQQEQDNR